MTRRSVIPVVLAALLVSLCIAWVVRRAIVSIQAERTLQAYRTLLNVLTAYLIQNSGKWPRSWDDLSRVRPEEWAENPFFQWPRDLDEFRKRVHIDFRLTGAEVSQMDVENFSAVQQIGVNYGPHEPGIQKLLQVARNMHESPSEKNQRRANHFP